MSKKKHAEEVEEEEVAPFWVISFSDMMTLLLSFFIMLFSMSTLEVKKMAEVVESMGNRFGAHGSGTVRARKYLDHISSKKPIELSHPVEEPEKLLLPKIRLDQTLLNGGIILFDSGSEQLTDIARGSLEQIAVQLEGSPYKIMIKGHASSQEITRGVYKHVDDLAYARSSNVRDRLVLLGIKQKHFLLVQVGSFEPLKRGSLVLRDDPDNPNSYVEIIQLSELAD